MRLELWNQEVRGIPLEKVEVWRGRAWGVSHGGTAQTAPVARSVSLPGRLGPGQDTELLTPAGHLHSPYFLTPHHTSTSKTAPGKATPVSSQHCRFSHRIAWCHFFFSVTCLPPALPTAQPSPAQAPRQARPSPGRQPWSLLDWLLFFDGAPAYFCFPPLTVTQTIHLPCL